MKNKIILKQSGLPEVHLDLELIDGNPPSLKVIGSGGAIDKMAPLYLWNGDSLTIDPEFTVSTPKSVPAKPVMGWLPIDLDDLPEREVLAGNFKPGSVDYQQKLVGSLIKEPDEELARCATASFDLIILNCTHYIDIDNFDVDFLPTIPE